MSVSLTEDKFSMLRIFPEQIHTFWSLIKEAIIDSFSSIQGSIDEAEVASIQSEIMGGKIQVLGIAEVNTETLMPEKMIGIILTIISNEPILKQKSLIIIGIRSFSYVPDSAWSKILIGLINVAREENCTVISCVTKNERVMQLCRDNGFDCDIKFCFLRIGV